MEIGLDPRAGPLTEAPVAGGHVGLHPYDRLDLGFFRLLLKFPGGVHVSMVRDRQRGLFQLLCAADQVVDAVRSVEQRILGMAMQMNEAHGRCKLAVLAEAGECAGAS